MRGEGFKGLRVEGHQALDRILVRSLPQLACAARPLNLLPATNEAGTTLKHNPMGIKKARSVFRAFTFIAKRKNRLGITSNQSDRGSSPWSTPPQSPSRTSLGCRRTHRLPPKRAVQN